jgi:hypothetical protein
VVRAHPECLVHPATALAAWLGAALLLQHLEGAALGLSCALATGLALAVLPRRFLALLFRSRWLLLALLLAHALLAPEGEPAGWKAGGEQAARLVALLALLALVLGSYSREALLAGFYVLLMPLSWAGVKAERVAVRLWLTLHYAEGARAAGRRSLADLARLPMSADDTPAGPGSVMLPAWRFSWRDACVLAALAAAFGWLTG